MLSDLFALGDMFLTVCLWLQVDDYDDEPRRGGRGGGGAPIAIDLPTGRNMLKYWSTRSGH